MISGFKINIVYSNLVILFLENSTGNNLKAKPGKIVAGLEVAKTLELLQAIAEGIASQVVFTFIFVYTKVNQI